MGNALRQHAAACNAMADRATWLAEHVAAHFQVNANASGIIEDQLNSKLDQGHNPIHQCSSRVEEGLNLIAGNLTLLLLILPIDGMRCEKEIHGLQKASQQPCDSVPAPSPLDPGVTVLQGQINQPPASIN
ncbi:hypothetical protein DSO57_1029670 [Entomophthora muscae]|uniref:Uncharacterized protein n=1 Tax=Entomophthora muscae TaxID=34485 RepID=A0ACC2SQY3_9FUNG|nr:hypothetical protein DSO57_1029670 [Entomophthora muscae]